MITDESHYVALAAAYARGALGELALDDETALARGIATNLKLHRFKRSAQLPRVRAVLGALRGFGVTRLVDLGSGRGAFVWPLLDALPDVVLTASDLLEHRAQLFAHVQRGGIARLSAVRADMTALPFADASADCVTALEVLEHLPDDGPARAIGEAMRVARTAVIATVPSHEDENPEHVHLFDGARLEALFRAAGARRVRVDHVLNHIVVVAVR
ncbi:MAG TPA: class I SAM-dependent methyltransferase [Kofleriaceae bacterium]|nr:class I SAM-dependent methyltransferase [Kofleriaceae bacterium]